MQIFFYFPLNKTYLFTIFLFFGKIEKVTPFKLFDNFG